MGNRELIYKILFDLGIKKIRNSSNGFTALCPFHDDNNPSFSINTEGLWICFACGEKGNLPQLIEKLKKDVNSFKNSLEEIQLKINNLINSEKPKKKEIIGINYTPYSREEEVPQYLLNRLSFKTIKHFGLGFCEIDEYRDYVIIPIKYNRKIVGFQARFLGEAEDKKRYLNPPNWNIKKYLFNFDAVKDYETIIVTEGVFSVMSMWEKRIQNSLATFGANVSNEQLSLLLSTKAKYIVLCFDNDEAGIKCALEAGEKLYDFVDVRVMLLPEGKDPNDLERKEIYLKFRDSLTFKQFKEDYGKKYKLYN